ncbi:MAG: winged helix DNA-binding domain-containing protein [Fermentimonas sp.]|nr:winged helix DNA-binding domain-containing protein [Fermentimonas sp.]
MNNTELLNLRLYNQLLSAHTLKDPVEIVSYMCAIQSQALEMAKWAIGSRLKECSNKSVTDALNTGEIIRTHILRPTWHFVAAEDIYWMYELSYSRLKPVYQSYAKMLKADETLLYSYLPHIESLLRDGRHLTKQEIGNKLKDVGFELDDNNLSVLLSFAELERIIVNGRLDGNKQTFTLLEEWSPYRKSISRDEALERLADKFFRSHGPATLQDFVWWSGLTLTECRKALEMINPSFVSEMVNGRECWMANDIRTPPVNVNSALLLAPFDEFLVSYKDRSEIFDSDHLRRVVTKNGIFSPTIMLNGKVIGTWKKIMKRNNTEIVLSFFEKVNKCVANLFEPEKKRLEEFYKVT